MKQIILSGIQIIVPSPSKNGLMYMSESTRERIFKKLMEAVDLGDEDLAARAHRRRGVDEWRVWIQLGA